MVPKYWIPAYRYFKAGVILTDLRPACRQSQLFALRESKVSAAAMTAMDAINIRFGSGVIRLSSTGRNRDWQPRASLLSDRYTTRLSEIVHVQSW